MISDSLAAKNHRIHSVRNDLLDMVVLSQKHFFRVNDLPEGLNLFLSASELAQTIHRAILHDS